MPRTLSIYGSRKINTSREVSGLAPSYRGDMASGDGTRGISLRLQDCELWRPSVLAGKFSSKRKQVGRSEKING